MHKHDQNDKGDSHKQTWFGKESGTSSKMESAITSPVGDM